MKETDNELSPLNPNAIGALTESTLMILAHSIWQHFAESSGMFICGLEKERREGKQFVVGEEQKWVENVFARLLKIRQSILFIKTIPKLIKFAFEKSSIIEESAEINADEFIEFLYDSHISKISTLYDQFLHLFNVAYDLGFRSDLATKKVFRCELKKTNSPAALEFLKAYESEQFQQQIKQKRNAITHEGQSGIFQEAIIAECSFMDSYFNREDDEEPIRFLCNAEDISQLSSVILRNVCNSIKPLKLVLDALYKELKERAYLAYKNGWRKTSQ